MEKRCWSQVQEISVVLAYLLMCVSGLQFRTQLLDGFAADSQPFWWHCQAEDPDDISYSWRFGASVLPVNSNQQVFPNGSLLIEVASQSDVGTYSCTASTTTDAITSPSVQLQLASISQTFVVIPVSQNDATLGDTVTFECEISSVPLATISWTLNGQPVARGTATMITQRRSSLMISGVTYEDMGEYKCDATNKVLSTVRQSPVATLIIEGPPRFVTEPESQSVPQYTSATFQCVAIGDPSPTVTWYDNRISHQPRELTPSSKYTLRSENTELKITNAQPIDEGSYSCVIKNSLGEKSKNVQLFVTEPLSSPFFIYTQIDQTVTEGFDTTFVCQATGNPTPTISFRKLDDTPLPDRATFPRPNELVLLKVHRNDSGLYECQAGSNLGSLKHIFELTVQVAPYFTAEPQDTTVRQGGSVTLPCRADGIPTPRIKWYLPTIGVMSTPGTIDGVTLDRQGTLTISPTDRRHHGTYMCLAQNIVNSIDSIATVLVEVSPAFVQLPRSQSVEAGSELTLYCKTTGYPTADITWYRGASDMPLTSQNQVDVATRGEMTIYSVRVSDEDQYRCNATNVVDTVITIAYITVYILPTFSVRPQGRIIELGDDVELNCQSSGRPTPRQTWERDGDDLVIDDNMQLYSNNTLLISSIRQSQLGEYACIARNSGGENRATAEVYTIDIPIFLQSPADTSVDITRDVIIPCTVYAREQPIINWYTSDMTGGQGPLLGQSSNPVADLRITVSAAGDLIITNSRRSDEGWYLCVASNSIGSVIGTMFLSVLFPPTISSTNSPQSDTEKSTVTLTCQSSGDPAPTITWTTPGNQIIQSSSSEYSVLQDSLIIHSVNAEVDGGDWQCSVCNRLGCDSALVQLLIEGIPVITSFAVKKDVETSELTISCLGIGLPEPFISYMGGLEDLTNGNPKPGHMITDGVIVINAGSALLNYTCIAANKHGTDTKELSVPDKMEAPVIVAVSENSVNVTWLPAAPADPTVTSYSVEYRSTASESWLPLATVDTATSIVTIDDLLPFTGYTSRIHASNILGPGTFSNSANEIITLADAPGTPRNLDVVELDSSLIVRWSAPDSLNGDPDSINYEVQLSETQTSTPFKTVHHDGQPPLEVTMATVIELQGLVVMVRTINADIQKKSEFVIWEKEVVISTAPQPTSPLIISVRSDGPGKIFIKWQVSSNLDETVTGFVVAYAVVDTTTNFTFIMLNSITTRNCTLTNLNERTYFQIKVAPNSPGIDMKYSTIAIIQTEYDALSTASYTAGGSLMLSGKTIAIIVGSVGAALLILIIIVMIIQHRRLRRMESVSFIKPSHAMDRFYMENPNFQHHNQTAILY